jgi:tetraacyldisaccharide 4'-kinase
VVLLTDDMPALDPARSFRVRRRIQGFATRDGRSHAAPQRPFLLAGIARPERFEADVRSRVPEIAGSLFFPDHHPYSPDELRGALDRARALGADALVTTAKDEVRLPEMHSDLPVLVLRISAEIQDEVRFREILLARVRS